MRRSAFPRLNPRHHRSAAVVAWACLLLSGCSPALDWREVRPEQSERLRAMFPCKPDVHQRRVKLPGIDQMVDLHLLSCQSGDAIWALSYATLADAHDINPALDGLRSALLSNLATAANLSGQQQAPIGQDLGPTRVPRMTVQTAARAWSFNAWRPDGSGKPVDMDVRAWHFSHGLTVFQASAWRVAQSVVGKDDPAAVFGAGFQFPE